MDENCLNAYWHPSLVDAQDRLEAWRLRHDDARPHGSLRNLTLPVFADQAQRARKVAHPPDQCWARDQPHTAFNRIGLKLVFCFSSRPHHVGSARAHVQEPDGGVATEPGCGAARVT